MSKSLQRKLTLAFVLVAFTSVVLVAIFVWVASTYQLEEMIVEQQRSNLIEVLTDYYGRTSSWQGIAQKWEYIHHEAALSQPDWEDQHLYEEFVPHDNMGKDDLFGFADSQGVVIVPVDLKYPPGSKLPENILKAGTPVRVAGEQIATILASNRQPDLKPEEALFLQRTYLAILLAVIGALMVASLVGTKLAKTLVSPLFALKAAALDITSGHLEQQVQVESDDELGQLALAFNRMSQEVARINHSRRQMTADIAHDLSTPLTVISGYIEGLEDGTLPPTGERFQLIRKEIDHLQNLVGDLRMLSLADAGELPLNPHWISPKELLEQAVSLFTQSARQRNIQLYVDVPEGLPDIRVDSDRMLQILSNLVINSLRYTPSTGKVNLSARLVGNLVDIAVEDTGVGIDPAELPFIFDRFRRADKSRHSEVGQSGLGLAIVKALAEVHGGSVWAESAPGKGTSIHVLIPYRPLPE